MDSSVSRAGGCEALEAQADMKPVAHMSGLPATEKQVGSDHYKRMSIQPIEFIHANGLSFLQGNVVKYICRHKAKGGEEDVRKAIHYCELILEMEYGVGRDQTGEA